MKEIKIFLASSYELESDRVRFGDMIYRWNSAWERKGYHLTLTKWEDFPGFYEPDGQQTSYNRSIECSHIFVALFWHKTGRHTLNELQVAKNAANVTACIFRRDPASHLTDEEKNLYAARNPDKRLEDLNANSGDMDSFLQDQADVEQKKYSTFEELETAFKLLLKSWIKENDPNLTDNWQPAPDQHNVISFSEKTLNFDLASICDLLRKLNQIKIGNYQLSSSVDNANLMFCLNREAVSDEQKDLINRFNRQNAPLLLMQRKDQSSSSSELKSWYSKNKQYPVNYSSVDSLLLRFMQNLLLHFPEKSSYSVKRGALFLESPDRKFFLPAINLLGANEFSGEEIKELCGKLAACDEEVKKCKKQRDENPDPENDALYSQALKEQDTCQKELDGKIKNFLDLQRSFLQTQLQDDLKEFENVNRLWDSGQISQFIELVTQKTPSDNDIKRHCENLLKAQEAANIASRERIAAESRETAAEINLANTRRQLVNDFHSLVKGAQAALYQEKKDEAVKNFQKAADISPLLLEQIRRKNLLKYLALIVFLPLGKLQEEAGCWGNAAESYKKCLNYLLEFDPSFQQHSPETVNGILAHLALNCINSSRYQEALNYLNQITPSSTFKATALSHTGIIQSRLNNHKSALISFFKAYNKFLSSSQIRGENDSQPSRKAQFRECAVCAENIARVYMNLKNMTEALVFLGKATNFWNCFLDEESRKVDIREIDKSKSQDFSEIYKKICVLLKEANNHVVSNNWSLFNALHFTQSVMEFLCYEKKFNELEECFRSAELLWNHKELDYSSKSIVANLYDILGQSYQLSNAPDKAHEAYQTAEVLSSGSERPGVFARHSCILIELEQFEKALSKLKKGLDIVLEKGDENFSDNDLYYLYNGLRLVHQKLSKQCEEHGDIQGKENHLNEALKFGKKRLDLKPDAQTMLFIYYDQGYILSELEQFEEALSKFKKGLDIVSEKGAENFSDNDLDFLYNKLRFVHKELSEQCEERGDIQGKENHLNEALKFGQKSLELKLDNWHKSSRFLSIGSLHRKLNNFQEAWQNYQKAINLLEEQYFSSEDYVTTLDDAAIYNEAARILFELKNYAQALEYSRKGLDILCSHLNEDDVIVVNCRNFLSKIKEMAKQ